MKTDVELCIHRMLTRDDDRDHMEMTILDRKTGKEIIHIHLSMDQYVDLITKDCVSAYASLKLPSEEQKKKK